MALIDWDDSYSVGVPEIDEQHKRLFRLLNDVFDASNNHEMTKDDVGQLVDDLVSYVEYHFAHEQKYLLNHPEFEAHRNAHVLFVIETMRFVKKIKNMDEHLLLFDLLKFLVNWLQEHILETDRNYFRYVREHDLLPKGAGGSM